MREIYEKKSVKYFQVKIETLTIFPYLLFYTHAIGDKYELNCVQTVIEFLRSVNFS